MLEEMLVHNPKARSIGLDISDMALGRASASLRAVEFHKIIDGGKFPLADSSVDFVLSSEVLEHVYDTENAFAEINRVLKVGGRLLLSTPYHGLIKNRSWPCNILIIVSKSWLLS